MHIHRPLRHLIETYRLAAQDLRLWVLEVLAWWVGQFGDRGSRLYMRRCLRDARSETRMLIFLSMIARMSYRKRAPLWRRPPSVRRGFRYAYRRFNAIRLCTRGIALKTLDDIRAVLGNLDAIVERAIARLPRHGVTGKLMVRSAADPALAPSLQLNADEAVRAPDTS